MIIVCAAAARAAASAYSVAEKYGPHGPWTASARSSQNRAEKVLESTDYEQWHNNWVVMQIQAGWNSGSEYDLGKMQHPYVNIWENLSPVQQRVSKVFFDTVKSTAAVLKTL